MSAAESMRQSTVPESFGSNRHPNDDAPAAEVEAVTALAEPRVQSPVAGFACGEVRGGNGVAHSVVTMPGLRGVIYSRPCAGASGGDIHYLSVCGSGLMARVCLADVAGHGPTVAAAGREIHAHLRRSVDVIDERKVLSELNRRLERTGLSSMTTAVLATYYPPRRRLTVSYAGHPHGWLYRAGERRWIPLQLPGASDVRSDAGTFADIPLGLGLEPAFTRHRFTADPGDRLLLVTDGVVETTSPDGVTLDTDGIARLLQTYTGAAGYRELADGLLSALHAHADADALVHDDVTFFLGEFVEGPAGHALWHVVRNRLLGRAPELADPGF